MEKIWAVEPNYLVGYLETTLNINDELNNKPAAFFGNLSSKEKDIFSISGDTAIINIKGLLSHDGPSLIDRFFGFNGTGYGEILEAIAQIQKDDEVKTVRLIMDTPGGEVAGVDKVFQAISELSKSKTVIAESHGLIASAGYWIASAASKIIATSPADEIGSIGVVVIAIDFSKAREERGIKVVVIRSKNAPNKRPDVSTEKGKNTLQERVDSIERVFIGRISEGRGIPVETIKSDFARGSLFVAEDPDSEKDDALSVGMIDAVESSVIPTQAPKNKHKKNKAQDLPISAPIKKEEHAMDLTEALADTGLAREIEARDNENIAIGVKKEKTEATARVDKCKKFLISNEYPEVVKNLAIKVISGESEYSALEGAVCVIDAQKEEKKAADAQKETGEQKETPPDIHGNGDNPKGVCGSNEDFAALEKEIEAGRC
jgi:signal peptide peptidase SppA